MSDVLARIGKSLRPHTRAQYIRQFRLFIAYALTRGLTILDNITTILLFIEFLAANAISYRVIMIYISALKFTFSDIAGTLLFLKHL